MKQILTPLMCITAALMLTAACGGGSSSVNSALSQMEKAMEKVEKNKTSMTTEDWKELDKELEDCVKVLNEALESEDVGTMTKLKISAVVLRYAAVAGEAALHTVTDSLKVQMGTEEESQFKEVMESNEMKDVMKELEKLGKELENLGKK